MASNLVAFDHSLEKGTASFKQKNFQEAVTHYQAAVESGNAAAAATKKNHPDMHKALSNLAAAHAALSNWQASFDAASKCTVTNPHFLKGWGRLGAAAAELQKPQEALNAYRRAVALDLDASEAAGYVQRVKDLEELILSAGTKTQPTGAASGSNGPQAGATNSSTLDDFYYKKSLEKGTEAMKGKVYPEAVRHFTKAIDILEEQHKKTKEGGTDLSVLYANRSAAYFRLTKCAESAQDAARSVSLNPQYTRGFLRLAEAQMVLAQFAPARTNFEKVLELDPQNAAGKEGSIKAKQLSFKDQGEAQAAKQQAERAITKKREEAEAVLAQQRKLDGEEAQKRQKEAMSVLGGAGIASLGRKGDAAYLHCKYCNKYGHQQQNCPLKRNNHGGSGDAGRGKRPRD